MLPRARVSFQRVPHFGQRSIKPAVVIGSLPNGPGSTVRLDRAAANLLVDLPDLLKDVVERRRRGPGLFATATLVVVPGAESRHDLLPDRLRGPGIDPAVTEKRLTHSTDHRGPFRPGIRHARA